MNVRRRDDGPQHQRHTGQYRTDDQQSKGDYVQRQIALPLRDRLAQLFIDEPCIRPDVIGQQMRLSRGQAKQRVGGHRVIGGVLVGRGRVPSLSERRANDSG